LKTKENALTSRKLKAVVFIGI